MLILSSNAFSYSVLESSLSKAQQAADKAKQEASSLANLQVDAMISVYEIFYDIYFR
jgi:hypothetical protein